jgi:integrase
MTRHRRGHGEGTIQQLPSGNWRAQVSLEGRRISSPVLKTKRDCQSWIRKTTGQIEKGLTFDATRLAYGEFLEQWLKSTTLRANTSSQYRQVAKQYILPGLARVKLANLNAQHIQSLYNRLREPGETQASDWVLVKVHAIVHGSLEYAVETGLLSRNPAAGVIPPRAPDYEMLFYDHDQVNRLLMAARGDRFEALIYLAVTTGMREMELLGLQWSDVDWQNGIISVRRQLMRKRTGESIFGALKTEKARRQVALGEQSLRCLSEHYSRQILDKQLAGPTWIDHNLVFANTRGGPVHQRNMLERVWRPLVEKAGLPYIRFHDLRHTAASLMLAAGIPINVVSRRLGHSRPSITLDIYGHLMPHAQEQAAQMMDELVTPVMVEIENP